MTTQFRFTRFKFRSAMLALIGVFLWGYLQIEPGAVSPEKDAVQSTPLEETVMEETVWVSPPQASIPDGVPHPFTPAREVAKWCTQSSEGASVYFVTEARILEDELQEAARGELERLAVPLTETETVVMKIRRVFHRNDTEFTMMGRVESFENSMAALTFKDGALRGEIILYGSKTADHRYFNFSPGADGVVEVTEMNHEVYFSQECCPTCAEKLIGTAAHEG